MTKRFYLLALFNLLIMTIPAFAERWICEHKSVYWYNDSKNEYTLDTQYWIKNRRFISFEIDLNSYQIRNLNYASSWKSKKIETKWTKDVLFELYDEHGIGYIVTLFHPNADDNEKNTRRYAWLSLGGWNIELGSCRLN